MKLARGVHSDHPLSRLQCKALGIHPFVSPRTKGLDEQRHESAAGRPTGRSVRQRPEYDQPGAEQIYGRDDIRNADHSPLDDRFGQTATGPTRHDVVATQQERFGGMQIGAAFFGWLTATGTAVLITALLAAAGAAFGLGNPDAVTQASNTAPETIGLTGAIILLVVIFLAYYCGGYVAGRMARFNGAKQGLGVWLWALIIAVVVAILSATAGAQFNVLERLNGFPRIPINEGTLTTGGILTAIALAVVSLIGAVLGGLTGMRFHRRVDRAGFDSTR